MEISKPKKTITLFCGGDVNLGRRMNYLSNKLESFIGIKEMAEADCRIVNLECVIANKGEQNANKPRYLYMHARPEQTNILTKYNIDIVTTANNHAGDYGSEALLEELGYLDTAGILHAGAGKNFEEAFTPVYKRIGDITFAIFSVDSRRRTAASSKDSPGTAYLPIDKPALWQKVFEDRIRKAHEIANVVIVAPHWGENFVERPSDNQKKIGRLLIDIGADVVLGTHAHQFHGVENYKNRPIIYDLGDFLFDSAKKPPTACFTLEISSAGVEKLTFIPLLKTTGQTLRAEGKKAKELKKYFITLCKEFKTTAIESEQGNLEITFTPPPRETNKIKDVIQETQTERHLIEPLSEPLPEWTVDKVPDEAIISPQSFGALKLVGYYIAPEYRTLTQIKMIPVETYWTIEEPLDKDFWLSIKGVPIKECDMPPYGRFQDHEFLDYMWPVNRWKPGVIYREKYSMLAPLEKGSRVFKVANVDLQVEITVTVNRKVIGVFKDPSLIKMRIADLPYYNTEFDDIIYQSEPGKCWTAEQLAKVTGGEWIVQPPKGWYVQSFRPANLMSTTIKPRPAMFLANKGKSDPHNKILENINEVDGAIVSREVEGLPPNFPLLKVDNVERAKIELGIAARKRFQGKMIGVTGSNGKTTTCNMLEHVLGDEHKVTATRDNRNMGDQVPWVFSHVNQDDAYAIIEMNISSLNLTQGSISYEITPDIAIVTSVAPAHLAYKNAESVEGIAKYKSNIFCGMKQGSYAIINRDMPYYEIFEQKANSYKLKIISFGTHPEATVRMPKLMDGGEFFIAGKAYTLSCPVPVEQLYDVLAVIAALFVSGINVETTLEKLKSFAVLKGRGNILNLTCGGKNLTIIDSTKNANPLSMTYALQHLKISAPNKKARVAILGDIARLGDKSVDYHKELADAILAAEPDRILLCGAFMRYPYKIIKDKINCMWFKTLEDLLRGFYAHLQDGDTVLVKSSQSTGLSKVVELLIKNASPLNENKPASAEVKPPPALFDVKNFLPEGITPEQNGRMPDVKLKKIHCGGRLYVDAARAWLAMVRAAAQDGIFLSANKSFNVYRPLERQIKVFKERYIPIDTAENLSEETIRVEYDGKIWQLKPDEIYAAVPGTSSHGYGLAVDIQNSRNTSVKTWLNENAKLFGFAQEYDFEPWHYTYTKACEGIPARVLEIESLPPEPTYTAEEIEQVSGGKWFTPPPKNWNCNGMFSARPVKAGCLAVVNQDGNFGVSEKLIGKVARQLAGFICTNPEPLVEFNRPILVTSNIKDAIENLSALFKA